MVRLDTKEAAEYLFGKGGSAGTLQQWRFERRGPRYLKLGNLVRHETSDLDKWIEQCAREPDPVT